jgi:hypothetical protein
VAVIQVRRRGRGSAHCCAAWRARHRDRNRPHQRIAGGHGGFEVTTIEDTLGRGYLRDPHGHCEIITPEHMRR